MDDREKEFRANIHKYLEDSGEKERLLNLLQKKLYETNWREKVILDCNEVMQNVGIENVEPDTLYRSVKCNAMQYVPETIRRQIQDQIYEVLEERCNHFK